MEYNRKFDIHKERNLTMLVDFYELTMANGYLESGVGNKIVCFDMFFRRVPDEGGYCIMAGVDQLIQYLSELCFSKEDIDYLKNKNIFSEKFISYLENFKFTCDVYAVPEGTPVFPNEPLVTVVGPVMEAQFVETMILLTINHQTLIATKANRICRAAGERPVLELGSRRAQGYDGAIFGARAAVIGGCSATACTIAEQMFNIPAVGTMAHSWVQLFDDEYSAFKAWAEAYPDNCLLLVDTYNVLKSGLPNAIKVFDEVLKPKGKRPVGIRIDSGDITYLTKEARKMLDEAGYKDAKITISNSLDEYIIKSVLSAGAKIDSFGVGERLITARSEPVFGGVYKLSAVQDTQGNFIPRIKISENAEKITNPGFKDLYRLYDKKTGKAIADLITLHGEEITEDKPLCIFDEVHTWKKKILENFTVKNLREKIFQNGKCTYKSPDVKTIQNYCSKELSTLWQEVLRFENPHTYYVDLSEKLWHTKRELLNNFSNKISNM
ncbi:nicotinate phosphoribosyltransferase [Hathewaya proteolytica DSM 3090]|uniref:Nicotinate phosphoribosyltransferase n=1 Tax=Hathewaya proteolytica DSM 3090 TaxID=1121331 RepID=A0A1M6LGE2_9CLOT|nr:nicotinate phosphoribosyltransferase [Hathewaya proteolytica]SHJ70270.1 nicotinate phosphoribosyltransferase [Hathewaya proteolytica DSM 3090]